MRKTQNKKEKNTFLLFVFESATLYIKRKNKQISISFSFIFSSSNTHRQHIYCNLNDD